MKEELPREMEALIQGYLDESLTEAEAARLREWLKEDEAHLDELVRAADLHGVLAALRSQKAPAALEAAPPGAAPGPAGAALEELVRARLKLGGARPPSRSRQGRSGRILRVAGSLAAVVAFVFLGQAFTGRVGAEPATVFWLDKNTKDAHQDWGAPPARSLMERLSDGETVNTKALELGAVPRTYSYRTASASLMRAGGGQGQAPEGIKADGTGTLSKMDQDENRESSKAKLPKGISELSEDMPKVEPPNLPFSLEEGKKAPPQIPSPEKAQASTMAAAYDALVDIFDSRPGQDNRKIVRNAEAAVEVDSYEAAYAKLLAMIAQEKGYVSSGDIQKMPNGKIQANVTVRLPAARFDDVLGRLKELGTVKYQNIKSEDVTKDYFDHEARLKSKELLLERLKAVLKDAKGTAKDLMEVEVQIGATLEAIDKIKGELRYYDTVVSQSTLILGIVEKDLAQPFEYVQTLQSTLALVARDPEAAFQRAQKEIQDAGGQIVDSKMVRQSDTSATGTVRARVEAEKFPALRAALKSLGHVTDDTVNQQKTARGGTEGLPKSDAPLKKELAVIDLSITTPALSVTRHAALLVESDGVPELYPAARRKVEEAGGKVTSGSLSGHGTNSSARLTADIDIEKFAPLLEALKAAGTLKDSRVQIDLPPQTPGQAADLFRERAEIELTLVSPSRLVDDEHGIGKTVRDTFAGSWKGILWSVEKLFVGLSLAGPWLGLGALGWLGWRAIRRKKPAAG